MNGMDTLREAVDTAFQNYRKGLGKLVIQTLTELSKADPESLFTYNAGMGYWGFTRNGKDEEGFEREDEIEPEPAFSAIMSADSDYGNSAVPDGEATAQGGKITHSSLEL